MTFRGQANVAGAEWDRWSCETQMKTGTGRVRVVTRIEGEEMAAPGAPPSKEDDRGDEQEAGEG